MTLYQLKQAKPGGWASPPPKFSLYGKLQTMNGEFEMNIEQIKAWQTELVETFHLELRGRNRGIDGLWGDSTRRATVQAQQMLGVPITGDFDLRTETALANFKASMPDTEPHHVVGIDSYGDITEAKIRKLRQVGVNPAFWARYLGMITQTELSLAKQWDFPILPIAQFANGKTFSGSCSGSEDLGRYFARVCCSQLEDDLSVTIRRGTTIYADVEGGLAPKPSPEFLKGWSEEVRALGHSPCLYFPNTLHAGHWAGLTEFYRRGGTVDGLWIAYYTDTDNGTAGYKDIAWDAHKTASLVSAPVNFWQYIGNAYQQMCDFNMVNPSVDLEALQAKMVQP